MNPGIHRFTMADYLADPCPAPSLSSGLAHTLLSRSPLHAWTEHPRLNTAHKGEEETKFDIGTAAHSIILEGEDKVAVVDAEDWRTKHAQTMRLQARSEGLLPLLRKHYDAVKAMAGVAREFMATCELAPRLKDAEPELTIIWKKGDVWLRARPDLWSKDRGVLVNYKTCESAEPNGFIRRMPSLGYDLSAALYEDGAKSLGHKKAKEYFLAQEISPPYSCSLIGMSEAMREVAQSKYEAALKLWQKCMATGKWPTYGPRIYTAEPTMWELDQAEERRLTFDERLEFSFA